MNTQETWKDIPGFPGYQASDFGNIRSVSRNVAHYSRLGPKSGVRKIVGRVLKQKRIKNRYPFIILCLDGKPITCSVHRLVALTFIPNPDCKPQVNHRDGNKQNNRKDNLEWVTNSENANHAFQVLGRKSFPPCGENNHYAKLSTDDVRQIRAWWKTGDVTQTALASKWGITSGHIFDIVHGFSWKHVA